MHSAILGGVHLVNPYLILRVRRENIVQDTLQQLVHFDGSSADELKKELKVRAPSGRAARTVVARARHDSPARVSVCCSARAVFPRRR